MHTIRQGHGALGAINVEMSLRTTAAERFDIDPIRGIVCLALCVLHFYYWPLEEPFHRIFGEDAIKVLLAIRPGVESFLVVAGVLVAHSLRPAEGERVSPGMYLLRRFVRLGIPYMLMVGVAAVNRWAPVWLGVGANPGPSVNEVLAQMFFVHEVFGYSEAAVGYWSLVAIEHFYILYMAILAIVLWTCPSPSHRWGIAYQMLWPTFLLCIASAVWWCLSPQFGYAHSFDSPLRVTKATLYVGLGVLLYWAVRAEFGQWALIATMAAVLITAIYTVRAVPYRAIVTVAIVLPLLKGRKFPQSWLTRGISFVGRRAYSLYLVHVIFGHRMLGLLEKQRIRRGMADAWSLLELALTIAVCIAIAEIFYRLVERPLHRVANRISFRRPIATTPQTSPESRPLAAVPTQ